VRFFRQDALADALPEGRYDAVVTFFFLDCFMEGELRELLGRIAGRLAPGAIWLMSDFTTEAGWHAKAWIWVMYRFFNVTTGLRARALPPIEKLLSEIGMRRTVVQQRRWGMIVSEVLVHQLGGGVMLP
jgi:tRNA (cmo5U34)-methyltransferase